MSKDWFGFCYRTPEYWVHLYHKLPFLRISFVLILVCLFLSFASSYGFFDCEIFLQKSANEHGLINSEDFLCKIAFAYNSISYGFILRTADSNGEQHKGLFNVWSVATPMIELFEDRAISSAQSHLASQLSFRKKNCSFCKKCKHLELACTRIVLWRYFLSETTVLYSLINAASSLEFAARVGHPISVICQLSLFQRKRAIWVSQLHEPISCLSLSKWLPVVLWSFSLCNQLALAVCHSSRPGQHSCARDEETVALINWAGASSVLCGTQPWQRRMCRWKITPVSHRLSLRPSELGILKLVRIKKQHFVKSGMP